MKKEKSCGAIVFKATLNHIYVLLVEQIVGHWGFPKGHVEINETEERTAIREVKEETNIDIKIIPGFREINSYSPYPLVIKDVVYFVAKPLNNNLIGQDEEIKVVEWVPIQEAKSRITYDNDQKIFDHAIDFYLKNI
ncbi:bis(5'-nucleosyl)-tetraphosphatase [Metamycoplasma buccale]|uniref:bis(5'-nucleosyl)-tetraphosphatase n=1 Tax=Metamycoplasma buccale TaxID=55602 RepID=UPI00398EFD1C